MNFWRELRRRRVVRIAAVYAATGWLVLQLGDTVLPALHVPGWSMTLLVARVAFGFPLVLIGTLAAACLKSDPVWNPIRSDPRFQTLLKQPQVE